MNPTEALAEIANILNCALETAPMNLRTRLGRDASKALSVLDALVQRDQAEAHQVNNGG